jgi:threonine dehydratase
MCARGAPAVRDALSREPGAAAAVAAPPVETIADGIAVRVPVAVSVADLRGLVDDVLLVDDAALVHAMRLLYHHAGLVSEPAGAAGLAAILAAPAAFEGQRVATIVCGGNATHEELRAWGVVTTEPQLTEGSLP